MTTAVLCGGVGAARFLRGLAVAADPSEISAIVNVGDDTVLHGLHISPDLDTVMYTLADAIDPARGWGLRDETWQAMEMFGRYGKPTWFRLGDRDLATHIVRTEGLRDGASLSEVTSELAASWGLATHLVPVTDDPLRTMLTVADGEIGFQEYFVDRQHDVEVRDVRFAGAESTTPAPGVLDAIAGAKRIVIAPSNPVVSIDPVLAVPGVRDAITARRDATVAISPIVGGEAIKGPAARLLRELGEEPSVVAIARRYARLAATLVIDEIDAHLAEAVREAGMGCIVTDTIMRDTDRARALAEVVVA